MRHSFGITSKLITILLVISIPMILVVSLVYVNWYGAREQTILQERTRIAEGIDVSITLLITNLGRVMRSIGGEIAENEYTQAKELEELGQLLDEYPVDFSLMTTGEGTVTVSTDEGMIGKNLAQETAFRQVIRENKELGVGNSMRVENAVGFYVARAIYGDDGQLQGIVASFVDVGKLHNEIPVEISQGGTNIVDASGRIVYQSEFPELAQERAYWGKYDFIQLALDGKNAEGLFNFPPTGEPRLVSEIPVEEFGWAAGSGIDVQDAIAPIRRNILYSSLLTAAILAIAIGIAIFIARGIIGSLSRLVAKLRAIGEGRLDEPIVIGSGDEIESVAESLDETRLKLKGAISELQLSENKAKSELEISNLLLEAADLLAESTNLDAVLSRLADIIARVTGRSRVNVNLFNKGTNELQLAALKGDSTYSIGFRYSIEQTLPQFREALIEGRVAIIDYNGSETMRDSSDITSEMQHKYALVVPIVLENELIGNVTLDEPGSRREFTQREIALVKGIASQAAVAISNAQLHTQTEEELSRTRLLQGVAFAATVSPSINTVAEQILQELADHMYLGVGIIHIFDSDERVLRILASLGASASMVEELQSVSLADEEILMVRAAKSKRILTHKDDRPDSKGVEYFGTAGLENVRYLAIPFEYRDKVVGTTTLAFEGRRDFTDDELEMFSSIGRIIGQAFENARLFEEERDIADTLQGALLTIPKKIKGIEFGHLYRSAAETAQVGGDFYDLFEIVPGKVAIVVGDVSGKGIGAATVTSTVKNAIKAFSCENDTPAEIMARTNDLVTRNTPENIFITVFLGILDTTTGELSYTSGGHPPALVKRNSGVELLEERSPMIGAFSGIGYSNGSTTIHKSDILILYTDGIIEARCNGDLYGENRLVDYVRHLEDVSIKELPGSIFGNVLKCSNGMLFDDVALLAVALSGN